MRLVVDGEDCEGVPFSDAKGSGLEFASHSGVVVRQYIDAIETSVDAAARLAAIQYASLRTLVFSDRDRLVVTPSGGDDTATIAAAIDESHRTSTELVFGPGVFNSVGLVVRGPARISGAGRATVIRVKKAPGQPNTPITVTSDLGDPVGTWTGQIGANARTFTIPQTGLSVGDTVFLRLGTDPYDSTQPLVRMFNVVETVAGDVVTLRIGIPESIPDPSPTTTHKIYRPSAIAENVSIDGLALDYEDGEICDQAITVVAARNVSIRNVFGVRTAGGILVADSENVEVDGVYSQRADRTLHGTSGRLAGAWGCRGLTLRNLFGQDVDGVGLFLESQNRGVVVDGLTLQSGPGAAPGVPHVQIAGGSTGVVIRNLRINSTVSRPVINAVQGSQYRTEDVFLENGCQAFALARHSGLLQWNGKTYWRLRRLSRTISIPIAAGIYRYTFAEGVWTSVIVQISSLTGITWCEIGEDITGKIAPGVPLRLVKGVGPNYPDNKTTTDEKKIIIQTDGTGSDGQWMRVEADFLQAEDNSPFMSDGSM